MPSGDSGWPGNWPEKHHDRNGLPLALVPLAGMERMCINATLDLGWLEAQLEWVLPTKAVIARTFGIAKVQFFMSLRYVVEACDEPEAAAILRRLTAAVEEAVYTRLAEELYASFVTSRTTSRHVKELAAQHLVDMWEGRVGLATNRFCPVLRRPPVWTGMNQRRIQRPTIHSRLLNCFVRS